MTKEERNQKRIDKVVARFGDNIVNLNDLTGGKEPSKLFYILGRYLYYLIDTDVDKCITKSGVKLRKAINPIIKKIGPSFLHGKQVFEDRESLMYPKGRKKKDKDKPKYSKDIELPDEPVIWMSNHAFKDDVLASILASKRHCYLLLGSVPQFYNTLDGITSYLNGVVLTNRKVKKSKKATIPKVEKAMEYGADLMIFPEGVWNKTPHIPIIELWHGIYRIAKSTGAKIVPIVHYTTDLTCESKDSIIHTVIDDPIDISGMEEEEAMILLRDTLATWYVLMMEKYGKSKRKKELKGFSSSQEAWEHHLEQRVKTADRYDVEIETCADYRPNTHEDPTEIWEKIAKIENITAHNVKNIEYAKILIKEKKDNDFQRRF